MERERLSKRQWLVWCCWSAGMNSQQTAWSLICGQQTVKSHRKVIRSKGWDWLS